ncbi:MAG: glucuronate isomerase [Clostridia bacterium]|nr:glucuronate isomerase [Clostridia bacterium]
MQAFMDKNFLLNTETARTLYHDYAAKCPIIDYHCHLIPREIYEDRRYENITQVWLGGDHYKWRLMRCAGVPEKYITGKETSDYEKFCKWAEVIGKGIGNPLYHWSHLELRNYFGYQGALSAKTADEVWNLCNEKLQSEGYSARGLISMSNVDTVCTTDDPIDNLEWHQKLAADASFKTTVLPAWRPDKAVNIEKPDFAEYIAKLAAAAEMEIRTFADVKTALARRMDFFAANNCCLSDHGLNYVVYLPASDEEVESIFARRMAGEELTAVEVDNYKTACMMFCAKQYKDRNWTMQLHYGCRRDNNLTRYAQMGPDTGYDCIDNTASSTQTAAFLGAIEAADALPQTILYSLNPNDNQAIGTICGCFQSDEAVSKIQHGSAWWFNDHFQGMIDQLTSLANLGYLAGFVGMLTDSRSFLSYPRHEYFRRILCRLLGEWVEDGRFPNDMDLLGEIVRGISYENAKKYFHFASK